MALSCGKFGSTVSEVIIEINRIANELLSKYDTIQAVTGNLPVFNAAGDTLIDSSFRANAVELTGVPV